MPRLTRRHLLGIAARFVSLGAVTAALAPKWVWSQPAIPGQEVLATLIHDLYPHEGLGDPFYARLAAIVQPGLAGTGEEFAAFTAALDREAGAPWQGLAAERRQAILRTQQESPFFLTLRNDVNAALYIQPEVWALVGYGGNAIAQGGYLNRGFNEIDWLEGQP